MSVIEAAVPGHGLRDFYDPADFTEQEAQQELFRVTEETTIERAWMREVGLQPFATDRDIELATTTPVALEVVEPSVGVTPIWALRSGNKDYSPNLLRPTAHHVMQFIGRTWSREEGTDVNGIWTLSATSLVRSTEYQNKISSRHERKIAVSPQEGNHSSHEYGYAFDLDACGVYRQDGETLEGIHPRREHDFDDKVDESRLVLRSILKELKDGGYINYCEELPGTQQWVFHICANPTISATDVLFGLRLPHSPR